MLLTHALALSVVLSLYASKSPYEYVHSVRIELAKLILVGTRITYQATGDAGCLEDGIWRTRGQYSLESLSLSYVQVK